MESLKELLKVINAEYDCGEFDVMSLDEARNAVEGIDVREDDVVIHCDYCDDELNDADRDRLCDWLYNSPTGGWTAIKDFLLNQGYCEVDECDGSGGGLYYGLAVFRK